MTTKPDILWADEFTRALRACVKLSRVGDENIYSLETYPMQEFIRTHFIPRTGPVHEGWFMCSFGSQRFLDYVRNDIEDVPVIIMELTSPEQGEENETTTMD